MLIYCASCTDPTPDYTRAFIAPRAIPGDLVVLFGRDRRAAYRIATDPRRKVDRLERIPFDSVPLDGARLYLMGEGIAVFDPPRELGLTPRTLTKDATL